MVDDAPSHNFPTGSSRVVANPRGGGRVLPRVGDTLRLETRAMGCQWGIVLDPGPQDRVMVAPDAFAEVQRIESFLTVYRETSEVARLNREAATNSLPVSAELAALLQTCRQLHRDTEGAFDPATQAIIELWRTCREQGRIPSAFEVEVALSASGFDKLTSSPAAPQQPGCCAEVRYHVAGLGLNFAAIGKGYAIDRASEVLRQQGLNDFLLHGGYSSLYACGSHAGQAGWPVGLKNPLFTEESYLTLMLRDQALATSGSNVQFFRHEGKRYGHILDPRSGWPAEGLLSVTVVAPSAAEADALSTAFYVLGLEKSREYCDTHRSVGAILTPPPARGRLLTPVVCNLQPEQVFLSAENVDPVWPAEST
jgi:thiamine biosynthesis lipoprotein